MMKFFGDVRYPELSIVYPPAGALIARVDVETSQIVLFRAEPGEAYVDAEGVERVDCDWVEIGRLSTRGHTID